MGAAHPRSRRPRRRSPAASRPGVRLALGRRPDARRSRRPAPRAARRALRRRCVRELRAPRAVAGGRMRVADRTVRAEIHKERLATWPEHYPWIDAAGLQLLPQSRDPGAPRCRARRWPSRSTTSRLPRQQQRALGSPAVQARHPVEHERRDGAALRRADLKRWPSTQRARQAGRPSPLSRRERA